jgi:hypothetical protein
LKTNHLATLRRTALRKTKEKKRGRVSRRADLLETEVDQPVDTEAAAVSRFKSGKKTFKFRHVKQHRHGHRNLSTRTNKFALVQQTFLAKNPCKKSADLHSYQFTTIYYKGAFLQDSTKPLFTNQNRLETS